MAHPNSAQTIATTRRLIEALQVEGELPTIDLEVILQYSKPGVRKYVSRLCASGILAARKVPRPGGGMQNLVSLAADDTKLAAFLQRLDQGIAVVDLNMLPGHQRKLPNFQVGTMVHEMMDDLGMRIRKNAVVKPRRDPLVAALFGAPARRGAA